MTLLSRLFLPKTVRAETTQTVFVVKEKRVEKPSPNYGVNEQLKAEIAQNPPAYLPTPKEAGYVPKWREGKDA